MLKKRKTFKFNHDTIFDVVNYTTMILLSIVFIWPLWFVVIASVSDPNAVWNGDVMLLPVNFSLRCYESIFAYKDIWLGYRNTIFYTVVGTTVNVVMTVLIAFPLSRRDLYFGGFLTKFFMFTMYFSGGLIPTYMVVSEMGLVNTPWAMIIPNAVSFFNVIIALSFFKTGIPSGLEEAAELDGANVWVYFIRIVLPLSKAIIAVIILYYAVGHWNSFFNALIYINDYELRPLQLVLRSILINNTTTNMTEALDLIDQLERIKIAEAMKYGVIIVSAAPLLILYPFIQKYFVKGVMIGALKG